MNEVDLNRFEFDYDTTWNAFFLDQELNVYSRYGGRDENEPENRLSKESLIQTMREVLEVHRSQSKLAPGDATSYFQTSRTKPLMPDDIPLLKKSHQGCVHCHQVQEYRLLQSFHDGRFQRRDLFPYPLPENIGLIFDRRHGHRVEQIVSSSLASRTQLRQGDTIVHIDDLPIHSEYDVRWALQRATDAGSIHILVSREQQDGTKKVLVPVKLEVKPGWWITDISWRKSLRSIPFQIGFRGYSLTRSQRKTETIDEKQLAIRVISIRDRGLGHEIGLKKRDVIVGLQTQKENRTFAQFKSDLLGLYQPGDSVLLTVLRDGKRVRLIGKFPQWLTVETTVP